MYKDMTQLLSPVSIGDFKLEKFTIEKIIWLLPFMESSPVNMFV